MFEVSVMTIWRDLGALEEAGVLRRVRGGAVATGKDSGYEPQFEAKVVRAIDAKRAMARHAVGRHVRPGATLALEGGTTVAALVPFLPTGAALTILTNSLEVVRQTPSEGITVIGAGGMFRPISQTFVGPLAVRFFEDHRPDIAFISATGINAAGELLDPNPLEIQVKQALCRRARRIICLLDASKWATESLTPVLGLPQVDTLITDRPPPPLFKRLLARHAVALEVATR